MSLVHNRAGEAEQPKGADRPGSPVKVDIFGRELLVEMEQEAMEAVTRARRTHGLALVWDDKVQIDKRYNRVGMEKSTSGVAFADLNNNVIITGACRS